MAKKEFVFNSTNPIEYVALMSESITSPYKIS
jgi:hypothetical protein